MLVVVDPTATRRRKRRTAGSVARPSATTAFNPVRINPRLNPCSVIRGEVLHDVILYVLTSVISTGA